MSFYRILTTTECNASCSYCYQKNIETEEMSFGTAHQVALFICKQENEKDNYSPAVIEWFGGEPLMNIEAINIISKELSKKGLFFSSDIVTNGVLLDHKMIIPAYNTWNVRLAQITVDGLFEEYERIKGFPSGSFEKLVSSIDELQKHMISCVIRINHSSEKYDNEKTIIDFFASRYRDCNLVFSIVPLYKAGKKHSRKVSEEILQLYEYALGMGIESVKESIHPRERKTGCFATEPGNFTIAPDGRLFNCSHCLTDDQCIGSVWSYDPNNKIQNEFIRKEYSEECLDCSIFTFCKGGCRIAELGLAPMTQCDWRCYL